MKKAYIAGLLSIFSAVTLTSCTITSTPEATSSTKTTTVTKDNTTTKKTTTATTSKESTTTKKTTTTTSTTQSTTAKTTTPTTNTPQTTSKTTTSSTTTSSSTSAATSSKTTTSTTTAQTTTTEDTPPVPELVNLSIISMNDLHGYAYESSKSSATGKVDLASASYYINSVRNKEDYDNVLLIANGDMFQGTAFSNLSHGRSVVNAMNEMEFDAMGIGNHEFDWGLETILDYFDSDLANGEANFPLINGNVNYTSKNTFGGTANTRVGEANTEDNILPYTIVDKCGVKVGILSYIGPQKNDINQDKLIEFSINCTSTSDTTFLNLVKSDANKLKTMGADIIVLNIHNGTADVVTDGVKTAGIETDVFNNKFAEMKDSNGNFLIDAVINGHTHSYQNCKISREGGVDMPVVQAGSYCNALGEMDLTINTKTKNVTAVTKSDYSYIDDVNAMNNKDTAVSSVLNAEYAKIESQLKKVYCVNNAYANKSNIGLWMANVMKQYSSADIAFINTGGIRSTMSKGNVTINELYEINPFDNYLCYVEALGSELISFYNSNSTYYYFNEGFDVNAIDSNTTYKILTIDYVYNSTYFQRYFKTATLNTIDKTLCARDLIGMDCDAKKSTGLTLTSNRSASLAATPWKTA